MNRMTPEDLIKHFNNYIVIDIRTDDEQLLEPIPLIKLHVPYQNFDYETEDMIINENFEDEILAIVSENHNMQTQGVCLVCKSGTRSCEAVKLMNSSGYNFSDLQGGSTALEKYIEESEITIN